MTVENVKTDIHIPLSDDLIEGMAAISGFYGIPRSKAYHLAAHGDLPGCFKLGRKIFCSKAAAREAIAKKARGGK
jgi:hypothetical protein